MKPVFSALLVLMLFMPASATIINVPGDQPNIQAGISASISGDTVRVAPDTYFENIDFSGKNIVVGSWFLDAGDPSYISSTIINGSYAGSVVSFLNGEDNSAVITGFTIQNGYASWGGGINCWDNCNPTINYNTIIGNSTDVDGYGGGIFCYDSSPAISNNTISGNSAGSAAGGIACWDSSPVIINTIFWANSADTWPEIYIVGKSSPVITYCDVQGGLAGEGNIDCDPMFCDPESGNFYLDSASCCVGAGEGGVDIGVFGAGCYSPNVINIPDDYETIQEGIDASFDGDTVRVESGTYVENIDFSGKNIVVGSWFLDAGDTSFISSTIIDGGASGSVVTFESGEDNTSIITGFTIQNGDGPGGGIYCQSSNPTINYNTISGNLSSDGGGIYCSGSSPTINYNTISGNSADNYGGGIACVFFSSPMISNNTISGNLAAYGGGILCDLFSSPLITNTILWGDSAPNGQEIDFDDSSWPIITYCDVQGGWPGDGNIDCDPMFCDPESGNFYLHVASCCVGAGEGGVDIGAFGVGCGIVPTLSEWGMIILALLLLTAGTIAVIRRRKAAVARTN